MFARDYLQHGNNLHRHVFTIPDRSFDGGLEEITEINTVDEVTINKNNFDKTLSTKYKHSNSCPSDINLYFDNPAFESDFELENNRGTNKGSHTGIRSQKPSIPKIVNFTSQRPDTLRNTKVTFKTETDNTINDTQEQVSWCRRYETWPSPKTRRKSLTRNINQPRSFSEADNCCPYCRQNSQCCRDSRRDSRRSKTLNGRSHKCKDNRFKSSIRRHAMAESSSLDEQAVESLSKEDLLVLWKRSEIELQTKLNRITSQNNHLRQMINIVEAGEYDLHEAEIEDVEDAIKVTRL